MPFLVFFTLSLVLFLKHWIGHDSLYSKTFGDSLFKMELSRLLHGIQSSSWIPFFPSWLGSLYPIGFLYGRLTLLVVPWSDCTHTIFSATKTILLLEAQLWFNSKTTFFVRSFWNSLKFKTIEVGGEEREEGKERVRAWVYFANPGPIVLFSYFVIIFFIVSLNYKIKDS